MTSTFNRRFFLRAVSGLGAALTAARYGGRAAAAVSLGAATGLEAEAATSTRSSGQALAYTMLMLDGVPPCSVKSVAGGHVSAAVIEERPATPGEPVGKHLAIPTYGDIAIQAGLGMPDEFYEAIKRTVEGGDLVESNPARNGSVLGLDLRNRPVSILNVRDAVVREVGFPATDGSSKDAAYLELTMAPLSTEYFAFDNLPVEIPPFPLPGRSKSSKKWLRAGFRFSMDETPFEEACRHVATVDAFTVKQLLALTETAEKGLYELQPTELAIPNLVITLPAAYATPFYEWQKQFVDGGVNVEKDAVLEYLTPDTKTVLFTLTFRRLGLMSVIPDEGKVASETARRVKCEMYCESVLFNYTPQTPA